MKIRNVFDTIFSVDNMYAALADASSGRRYKPDIAEANLNAFEFIEGIRREIYDGSYRIEKYHIFYVFEPKKRMIMSIQFRHRVVQWAIYRVLNPILIKGYIKDSYGCIQGRGPLKAVDRLQYWLVDAARGTGEWYYLKLDISKYFYRVSHKVLKRILRKKIQDKRLLAVLYSIIDCDHTPFGLPPGKGPGDVELEDMLYDVGMPIGNLLSQLLANIYLNELDQYCKRVLGIKCYVRYMDDVIILHQSKAQLRIWKTLIERFLEEYLELILNKKTCIRPVACGIEFVGYRVWADRRIVRKSTTLSIKRSLAGMARLYSEGAVTMEQITDTLTCYLGMFGHADSSALVDSILNQLVLVRRREEGDKAEYNKEYNKYPCQPCEQMELGYFM